MTLVLEELDTPGFHRVVVARDADARYEAVLAIHDIARGVAIGGTRLRSYRSLDDAIHDAQRLARNMTLKSAFADLPFGGGKAVIVEPKGAYDRAALLRAHGRAIESLGGDYITAEDVGTTPDDLIHVRAETSNVVEITDESIDSAWATARGVLRAIEGATQALFDLPGLEERVVAVQGCGATGRRLTEDLISLGAAVLVADTIVDRAAACEQLGAQRRLPEEIVEVACDIFAPCALGGVLTAGVARSIRARVVAGSANNQLADLAVDDILFSRGVAFVPDFVANAGGVIAATPELLGWSKDRAIDRIDGIQRVVGFLAAESVDRGRSMLQCAMERVS